MFLPDIVLPLFVFNALSMVTINFYHCAFLSCKVDIFEATISVSDTGSSDGGVFLFECVVGILRRVLSKIRVVGELELLVG